MNYLRLGKITVAIAVATSVINVVLAYVGRIVSNPPSTFGPYMYSSVIGLTVAGVIAAAIVYAVFRRVFVDKAKADRYFLIVSVIVLIASFYPDIALPWSTDPDQVGWTYGIMVNLMLMHVVVAVPVLYYFRRA